MMRLKPRPEVLALAIISCTFLVGCPPLNPIVRVTPGAITFGAVSIEESIAILNEGGAPLLWTAREVVFNTASGSWEPGAIDFLTLESEDGAALGPDLITGEVTTQEVDWLRLVADRTGLATGLVSGIGVEIATNAGTRVVPLSMSVESALDVSPTVITIPDSSDTATFVISNSSAQALAWTISALSDPLDPASITVMPVYVTDVPLAGSVPPGGEQTVAVVIDREGLEADTYDVFLLVDTGRGNAVVRISFGVGGVGVFNVLPEAITIAVNIYGSGENPTEQFTISNPSDVDFVWDLTFEDPDAPGVPIELPGFISITPVVGTLGAGRDQVLEVVVARDAVPTAGITDIDIQINATDVGMKTVTLRVIAVEGARLSIRQEPRFTRAGILDFGTEQDLLTLGVGNTGGVDTRLDFELSTDRPELVLLPQPPQGTSIGRVCSEVFLSDFFFCYDWIDFPIVINRAAMDPSVDLESAEIRIEAEGQEPVVVAVKIDRAPLRIEGASNRARPPYLQRFVFLLRDSLLESIDTTDPDILRNVSLEIKEDDTPIELDETNSFITGPEGLTQNIVLLLDYTGSMFRAGEEEGVANGTIIADMVEGAVAFINDLPDTFRISIMEYHEKSQVRRVIHPFTTDKTALEEALLAFELEPADHGESEVFDALVDAIVALVAQDPTALPFDEADVRSIVFVSDLQDTSSEIESSAVTGLASETRVRLYPVAFGDAADFATAITMGNETGGHAYQVVGPRKLGDFLGTVISVGQIWTDLQRQLVLTYMTLLDRSATYLITATYLDPSGNLISGEFERDATFFPGDVRAGQITLSTTGIQSNGRVEVIVRTDYLPRNISQFRFRFIIPPEFDGTLTTVEIMDRSREGGILSGWHLIDEGDRVYSLVTGPDTPLPLAAFGNLMRLTFEGLAITDSFEIGFRVDNALYIQPRAESLVNTRFFQYPGGPTNPFGLLIVERRADVVGPAEDVFVLADTSFDPTGPFANDRDEDGILDFNDPSPDDDELPVPIVTPELVTFAAAGAQGTFTVRNNRLSTLEWSIQHQGLPFGVSLSQSSGALERDETITITVTVDRGALLPGTYFGDLEVVSNLTPAPTNVALTVEVL